MDIKYAIETIPDLQAVESDLQVIQTMSGYITESTPLKDAMLEVRTMKKWSVESIKQSCKTVMEVLGSVFQTIMEEFNESTDSDIDQISLKPFKDRYLAELAEHDNLKEAAKLVMEMASRVAVALNISVPASPAGAPVSKPKKSFGKALLSLVVEEKPVKGKSTKSKVGVPSAWLIEPVLLEDADSVQQLALMDKKLSSGGVAAIQSFAQKFNKTQADLAAVILDALDDARKQIALSDSVTADVGAAYTAVEKKINTILDVRNGVNATNTYVSGK